MIIAFIDVRCFGVVEKLESSGQIEQVSHFPQRAMRDRQEVTQIRTRRPGAPFNNVRRHRYGRPPQLRHQPILLLGRKPTRHPIDVQNQIVRKLERLKLPMILSHHTSPAEVPGYPTRHAPRKLHDAERITHNALRFTQHPPSERKTHHAERKTLKHSRNRFAQRVHIRFGHARNVDSAGADDVDGMVVAQGLDLVLGQA